MEALILTFDVLCMTWICWRVFRTDESRSDQVDLGFLSYRENLDEKSSSGRRL